MTRNEFDRTHAATLDTTEGYTAAELAQINDRVFAEVAVLDPQDSVTKSRVDAAMARAMVRVERDAELRRDRLVAEAGLTVEQIEALREEARGADPEQVRICDAALTGDAAAIAECARVVAAAAAQRD